MTAPCLMSASELESYAAFLIKLAGTRRGSLADHLRNAARELGGSE